MQSATMRSLYITKGKKDMVEGKRLWSGSVKENVCGVVQFMLWQKLKNFNLLCFLQNPTASETMSQLEGISFCLFISTVQVYVIEMFGFFFASYTG